MKDIRIEVATVVFYDGVEAYTTSFKGCKPVQAYKYTITLLNRLKLSYIAE